MRYLADRAAAYEHPRHVLDGARSILMLAVGYRTQQPQPAGPGEARVSRYAWGNDYHRVIRGRLRSMELFHLRLVPEARVRGVVDTAPLLERDFARLAGLGWIGKNTLLVDQRFGSWHFLAALLTTEELAFDDPMAADYCGTCRACLDACPTGALVDAYELDARRCISYLTIELRESIPAALRAGMGDRLFGCDACQEVCPWNRKAAESAEAAFEPAPGMNPVELVELFFLDDESFRARFRGTPLERPKRTGILRNAAVVLGNRPHPAALPALKHGLNDREPLVREACAWALERYGSADRQPSAGILEPGEVKGSAAFKA